MTTLRVATLNLWNYQTDRLERLEAAAAWIATEGIDVLCVQEIVEYDGATTSSLLASLSGLALATPECGANGMSTTAVLCNPETAPAVAGELIRIAPHGVEAAPYMALAYIDTVAGVLPVGSVHLAWGSLHEATRLSQLQHIVAWFDECYGASESEHPAIVAGDFNARPDYDSVRYFRGQAATAPATLWTDAWEHRDPTCVTEATSSPENPYAQQLALAYRPGRDGVLDATLLPERRIDYVFSRGWRHGRPFTPTNTRIVTDPLMSDHYPVVTDLLVG
jgi:endonuclease/exonuclease/phosphatase family metal-dependent hydrolase